MAVLVSRGSLTACKYPEILPTVGRRGGLSSLLYGVTATIQALEDGLVGEIR